MNIEKEPFTNKIDIIAKIHLCCCEYFNVPSQKVLSRDRHDDCCNARAYAWYILHHDYGMSITTLSKHYGRKRRNVFHVLSKITYLIDNQRLYRKMYSDIQKSIT